MWVAGVGVLAVLLVVGALAATVFGGGLGSLGEIGSGSAARQGGVPDDGDSQGQPSSDPGPAQTSSEGTTPGSSLPPDSPPDPAFDHLLPTLEGTTDAPVVLPAELPDEMDLPAIDGYHSGEGYGIVFPYGPTETIAEPSNAETLGTLTAYPEDEDVANEFFDAERVEEVVLPDGTEATLRYMVPAGRSGSQGPFWEGKFDEGGFTYNLKVVKPDEITEGQVRQALSTMVLVPESGESTTHGYTEPTTPSSAASEPSWMSSEEIASLEEFGREYDEAVRREDWEETYSMLDESSQQQFTEQEWAEKQQALKGTSGPPAPLGSVTVEQDEQVADSPVTVALHYEDGTEESIVATIPMVVDDPNDSGVPERILIEEEISELEEVAPSSPESATSASPKATTPDAHGQSTNEVEAEAKEQQIEQFVQLYYTAVAFEDWERTYSYLDPASQAEFTEDEWVSAQQARVSANDPPALESIEARNIGEGGNGFSVTALLDYADGTQETVEIEVSYENGRYERHLTGEEISYLRDLAGSGTQS